MTATVRCSRPWPWARFAGLVVYDLSRLARSAKLMFDLRDELDRHQVPLFVANLPGARFDGATGRYMFGQLCLSNQLQRDLDSERMTNIQRRLFEAGRHRGHDPYGYASLHDKAGSLVHPRQLVIVTEEAAVVRRVWREWTKRSHSQVAELLNREGLPRRGPRSRDSVKDIVHRLTPMDMKYGFTTECWEAEASDPALIADRIRSRADALLDAGVLTAVAARERVGRQAFAELARRLEAP